MNNNISTLPIFELSLDIIAVCTIDGIFVKISKSCYEIFGYANAWYRWFRNNSRNY